MTSPFDDVDATYRVLINEEEQYSLWPTAFPVPAGWRVALERNTRSSCVAFIETHWRDLRPRSLRFNA